METRCTILLEVLRGLLREHSGLMALSYAAKMLIPLLFADKSKLEILALTMDMQDKADDLEGLSWQLAALLSLQAKKLSLPDLSNELRGADTKPINKTSMQWSFAIMTAKGLLE